MPNIKILIADANAIVRQGLKNLITRDSKIVVAGEAKNSNEVLEKLKLLDIDVILMDIGIQAKNSLETLIHLKKINPDLHVIILSVYAEDHYGLKLIESGASSYLSKTCPPNQLLDAINKVAKGEKYITPYLRKLLAKKFDNEINKGHD